MTPFGEGLLQIADSITSAVANAGVAFRLFPDGRDHVDLVPGKGFQTLSFPDHADEGWPAFELRIPESFEFQGAYFSVLNRRAHVRSTESAAGLLDALESLAGIVLEKRPRAWRVTLANGAEVALLDAGDYRLLSVRQERTAADVEEALRNAPERVWRADFSARSTRCECGRWWCGCACGCCDEDEVVIEVDEVEFADPDAEASDGGDAEGSPAQE